MMSKEKMDKICHVAVTRLLEKAIGRKKRLRRKNDDGKPREIVISDRN